MTYKLEFKLKQHTPIIHFQHDQQDATLRATELKPKLDQFIFEKLTGEKGFEARTEFYNQLFNGTDEQKAQKLWLVGKGRDLKRGMSENDLNAALKHFALDYKVRVLVENRKTIFDKLIDVNIGYRKNKTTGQNDKVLKYKNIPGFFGNMMKVEEFETKTKLPKKVTIYDNVKVVIGSFNQSMMNEIYKCFYDFLIVTNFGTRQSKGFGSFYKEELTEIDGHNLLYFTIERPNDDYNGLFQDIDIFYRCLKSGINIKARNTEGELVDKIYFKSMMFKYAKNLTPSEQWDKRTIRHDLYHNDWKYKKDDGKAGVYYNRTNVDGTVHFTTPKAGNRNYYDFRDLLGLSTEQDWLFYRDKKVTKSVCKEVMDNGKLIKHNIDRYKSPITFKPIYDRQKRHWRIYIVINSVSDMYQGANVKISNKRKSTNLTIYPNFNLVKYIDFAIRNFDFKDIEYGDGFGFDNTLEPKILKGIFHELKKQIQDYDEN